MKDQNERRLFTAVAISLALIWLWQFFFAPPPPVAETAAGVVDGAPAEDVAGAAPAAAPVAPVSAASAEAPCTGKTAVIKSDTSALEVSDCGAIRSVSFPGIAEPKVVTGWWTWAWHRVNGTESGGWQPYVGGERDLDLLTKGELLAAGRGPYALGGTWSITSTDPLVQERTTSDGFRVVRTITRGATSDLWTVKIHMESDRPLMGPFWIGTADQFGKYSAYGTDPTLLHWVEGDWDAEHLASGADFSAPETFESPAGWSGVGDRFYLVAAAPDDPTVASRAEWARLDAERVGAFYVLAAPSLAPGAPIDASFTVYAGPRELARLEAAGHGFEEAVSLGWFGLFAKFLLVTLHLIESVVGDWGYSILALTLLVRVVTYPLTRQAVVSGRRMQALQPAMKALQEKYAEDKETLNREMMALYSKHGVNPLGGCFPMLVQMPVFIALFTALQYEPSLFNQHFFYVQDLSAQDPYGFLSLFVVVGMYVQQTMMPTTGMDPTQAQMLKLMPLFFGLMMWSSPAGLALYYSLNTVLAIVQQWYNTRSIPPAVLDGDANVPS